MTPSETPASKNNILTIVWLAFFANTILIPTVSLTLQSNSAEDTGPGFSPTLLIGLGVMAFIVSHLIFRTVSGKPILYQKYLVPFILSCMLAEFISLLGLFSTINFGLNIYTMSLFSLGFLSMFLKKPDLKLIAQPIS